MALQQVIVMILSAVLWINQSLANEYYEQYDPYYQSKSMADYYHYDQAPAYYNFDWSVKDEPSGNDYMQRESRDGQLTTGLYQVLLPDGRYQSVNYRVDKDSGFIADVSYQGEANYYSFKSNYETKTRAPSYYQVDDDDASYDAGQLYTYDGSPAYYPPGPSGPVPASSYYSEVVASGVTKEKPIYPSTTPVPTSKKTRMPPATTLASTTTPAPTTTRPSYDSAPDYTVPMYPLYRIDYYSARAKAGKTIPDPSGGYAVDDAGSTYIKADNSYFAPDKLGTYEIKHRKATARKPSGSDYKTPESYKMN